MCVWRGRGGGWSFLGTVAIYRRRIENRERIVYISPTKKMTEISFARRLLARQCSLLFELF